MPDLDDNGEDTTPYTPIIREPTPAKKTAAKKTTEPAQPAQNEESA